MGVPAFFRWLSRKYPSIVVHCVEQKPSVIDGVEVPVDSSQPNPNDVEFDNLYLDMNGIIHPCTHPENKAAPANEDEMMVAIFEYIERIFNIVRPRRLLYMAIDGVAPRAKMNQQRSRRFRASKDVTEKEELIERVRNELIGKGCYVPPKKDKSSHFDSNCITPGTEFMFRLAQCLRYFVHQKLNTDPGWHNVRVILSDANVPGEGEHKIMDYIRRQRAQPDHDPNTRHCLCGADADLIMLGLATHEPNFTIIREEFRPNQARPCELCGQLGHELKDCCGVARDEECTDKPPPPVGAEQEFIFLRLNVLREYLERELNMSLPFKWDLERAVDDWVFMCFFVGNDFLPHLPSLEIREGAIDRLIRIYKGSLRNTGGYLTENGIVSLSRVQVVMTELGKMEADIFRHRREDELKQRDRERNNKKRQRFNAEMHKPAWMMQQNSAYEPRAIRSQQPTAPSGREVRELAQRARTQTYPQGAPSTNEEAAAALKAMLKQQAGSSNESTPPESNQRKKPADESVDELRRGTEEGGSSVLGEDDPDALDEVKLYEEGWRERYYSSKFHVDINKDVQFRFDVARQYVRGLCWVLRYYYQGCSDWKWYYPYHYAPFACDFVNIGDISTEFPTGTEPFNPLEQLMGVFPAASREFLPPTWQRLMLEADSPIIDFYPTDFRVDLNGKKFAWQGVALLPFVSEKRLLGALQPLYGDLTERERVRNRRGHDLLFVSRRAADANLQQLFTFTLQLCEDRLATDRHSAIAINTKFSGGIAGLQWIDHAAYPPGQRVVSPVKSDFCPDLLCNDVVSIAYADPTYAEGFVFKAHLLDGVQMPMRVLKPGDWEQQNRSLPPHERRQWRPVIGMTADAGYRSAEQKWVDPALRAIRHYAEPSVGQAMYIPPHPRDMYGGHDGRGQRYERGNWGGQRDFDRNRQQQFGDYRPPRPPNFDRPPRDQFRPRGPPPGQRPSYWRGDGWSGHQRSDSYY